MAFSYAQRDGDLKAAGAHLDSARHHVSNIKDLKEFETRIDAACLDCEGLILQKNHQLKAAIETYETAVGIYPYSRTYLNLARAYMSRAATAHGRKYDREAAGRALGHFESLRPDKSPTQEARDARHALNALA